jgi:two-component system OmpR family response regulator/two-component system response regulator QseB
MLGTMRILVVEDDAAIADALQVSLRLAGHAVDRCATLAQAWAALRVEPFDAMLLDLGLPDGDGVRLLAQVRAAVPAPGGAGLPRPDMPVLIMTARDGVDQRVAGLDGGADDYLVKPFDPQELLARIRAMVRRSAGRASALLHCRDLVIDPAARTVALAGQPVGLGSKEFTLLQTLVEARPQVLSKARLEAALYGFGESLESNAIEVHVHHLRRKLGADLIQTMRGVGYFVPRDKPP